jgi:hypothetical protein
VYEICSAESADPIALMPRWPLATDHEHADNPPSPDQIEQAGHESLRRIMEQP